jgi:heme exporter protein D
MTLDLDMGKYAVFVWGSYGATFAALTALVVVSLRAQAVRRRKLEALQQAVEDKR